MPKIYTCSYQRGQENNEGAAEKTRNTSVKEKSPQPHTSWVDTRSLTSSLNSPQILWGVVAIARVSVTTDCREPTPIALENNSWNPHLWLSIESVSPKHLRIVDIHFCKVVRYVTRQIPTSPIGSAGHKLTSVPKNPQRTKLRREVVEEQRRRSFYHNYYYIDLLLLPPSQDCHNKLNTLW